MPRKDGKYIVDPHFQQVVDIHSIIGKWARSNDGCGLAYSCLMCPVSECVWDLGKAPRAKILRGLR